MSTSENIEAALKEAERVCKKHKVCAEKTALCFDKLIQALLSAQKRADSVDNAQLIQELHQALSDQANLSDLTESTKDLHSAVNKLGKVCILFIIISDCRLLLQLQCYWIGAWSIWDQAPQRLHCRL